MINKLLKILKITIVVECVILAAVFGIKRYSPKVVDAVSFRAHNSIDLDTYIVVVNMINLVKEDGGEVCLFEGSKEVDLAKTTSLGVAESFKGDIPTGTYKQMKIGSKGWSVSGGVKVKGSVTVNGVTYYTKTSHTGYTTPPAELEELSIWGTPGGWGVIQDFNPPIQLGGTISEINVLVDTSYGLLYFDGNYNTSTDQGFWLNFGTSNPAGFYIFNPAHAVTFGIPAKKEVYEYTTSWSKSPGTGRLVLLFDSSDKLVGGNSQAILVNNKGVDFKLTGWMSDYYNGSVNPSLLQKNADGTYTLKLQCLQPTDLGVNKLVTFPKFQRAAHTGSFTYYYAGDKETTSGTYTCTKVQ